jgi:oligopeptide transport system ATP-binding protein
MTRLLEVRDLVNRFDTEDGTVHAVNGISYTLDEGESMGIVGESGSGKSVSVLSLMGLIPMPPGRIERGEAIFAGRNLLNISREELNKIRGYEIAMVFQDPMTSLNPVLTVGLQMTEALELHLGLNNKQATDRATEMLSLVGIPNALDRLNDYPHEFSGGQRQRIGIAMALACSPSLLIADEPTTALDVTIQAQITDLVTKLKDIMGMAIIWITHDLGVVANLVDKMAVMYAGFIVEMAPTREIFKETSHPYTLGLLQSIPKVTSRKKQRLIPIEGLPPDLLQEPTSCPFAPRCRFVVERCWAENPPLDLIAPNHYAACWRADEVRNMSPEEQFAREPA